MKTFILVVLFVILLPTDVYSQSAPYSRVYFEADNQTMQILLQKGVAIDHLGRTLPGYTGEFSKEETALIITYAKNAQVLIADLSKYFTDNSASKEIKRQTLSYPIPAGFTLGSMGGYLTLEQMDSHINVMLSKYPNLISKKDSIGITVEGRAIYTVKISDNPNIDEDEPEVLYTALHHAREPISMMQLLYFMYYALENYQSNQEITSIINSTEMYFIPCVNPDGYKYNAFTNPNGGGYWRKNRLKINDTSYGVDLNRNYGYEWGINNIGSSDMPLSSVYRGASAFSEPETKAIRNFCNQRHFKNALNYHSFGNDLIYPWGNDMGSSTTPDYQEFMDFANLLTAENYYTFGTCYETLQYTVNGSSDDWMYGEQSSKLKMFALTPEIGNSNDGFWPPIERILILCDANIRQNINNAKIAIALTPPTSIKNVMSKTYALYPNPTSGKLYLRDLDCSRIELWNMQSQLVQEIFPDKTGAFDVSALPDAVYTCKIYNAETIVDLKRVIILH